MMYKYSKYKYTCNIETWSSLFQCVLQSFISDLPKFQTNVESIYISQY